MIELREIFISSDGETLEIRLYTEEGDEIVEVFLHDSSTYPNTDLAYDISEFFFRGSATIHCNDLGLLMYEGGYVLEIITKENNIEKSTTHFFGNFTGIYSCLVDSTINLKVENCTLIDSENSSVDIATKNFIDFELIKILVEEMKDYVLAGEVLCQLEDRCNCFTCTSKKDLVPIIGYNFIKIENE